MAAPASSAPKLRLRDLRRRFAVRDREFEALAGVSLDVAPGEFLAIVGPSGCGKTTLLRIVAELETPTSGTVEIAREPGATGPLNAMVFQQESVFPWKNVRDNAAFGSQGAGLRQARALCDGPADLRARRPPGVRATRCPISSRAA